MNLLHPSPPHHRVIFAVDIEGSTTRNNATKADLRGAMYELVEQALRDNGIAEEHHDQFVDRGDGILALIRPVDEVPKTLLLSGVVPTLAELLVEHEVHNPGRHLRLRAVVHAGEVHQDIRGPFGESLDVAFRLLDAPEVKDAFRLSAEPLLLVVSELIYRTIVRQGYTGIDERAFRPIADVVVAGLHQHGWVCVPDQAADARLDHHSSGARILRAARRFEDRRHVV